MSEHSHRALPREVWTAFFAFVVVAVTLGALYGSGIVSGIGLSVGVFCMLLVFVPWAVFRLDVKGLTELRIYGDDQRAGP